MTNTAMKLRNVLCAGLILLGISQGCGSSEDGPVMAPVKGKVTIDGTPIPKGDIVLEPVDGKGRAAAGVIQEGSFEFSSPVGKKKVMIFASRKTGAKGDFGEDVMESYIPEKYNTNSELTGEVTSGAENEFTFDLKEAQ